MSTPVAGPLVVTPLFVSPGDLAVWWNDPTDTWESVPLGSGPAGPQGPAGAAGATGPTGPVGPTGATGSPGTNANITGMAAGQIPIAATATSITSSGNLSGDVVSTPTTLATTIQPNAVTTAKINNAAVAYAKIQNVTNNRILGNTSGSAAPPAEIALPLSLANGGTGAATAAAAPWVETAGDTMTGALAIEPPAGYAALSLRSTAGTSMQLLGYRGTSVRWEMLLGSSEAESGGNAGTNFYINRYSDAGGGLGSALTISRATGNVTLSGEIDAGGARFNGLAQVHRYGAADPLLLSVDSGRFCRIYYQGTRNWTCGPTDTGAFCLVDETAAAFRMLVDTGGNFEFYDGYLSSRGNACRSGVNGTVRTNHYNIDWTSIAELWIDNVKLGQISFVCDHRLKDNVAALPSTWDRVKALRPISYTYKACPELLREADDPALRWGFLAHELQETLLPTAASGEKDAPNLVQSPDLVAMLAAVTRALQEAQARIEALEARVAV